jgi:DNA-binding Lrp family transcriptional regulator
VQTIFVMVKCDLGKAYQVADEAVAVEHVSEVYSTSGQYDLLMKCYLDEKTDIGHFVTSQIQTLAGVKDTFTLITFKAFS